MVRVKITKTYKHNPTLFSKAEKGDQMRFQKIRESIDNPESIEIITPPNTPPIKELANTSLECSECGSKYNEFCKKCVKNDVKAEKCKICYRWLPNLAKHMQTHAEKGDTAQECPTCGKRIKDPSNFRRHVRKHKKK